MLIEAQDGMPGPVPSINLLKLMNPGVSYQENRVCILAVCHRLPHKVWVTVVAQCVVSGTVYTSTVF